MNFLFEGISTISVDGRKVCSLALWLFIRGFELGRMEMSLFYLSHCMALQRPIHYLVRGSWNMIRALIPCGSLRKLSLLTY